MRIGLEYGKVLQRIENIQGVCVGLPAGRAQAIRNTQVQQPFVIGSGTLSPGWRTIGRRKNFQEPCNGWTAWCETSLDLQEQWAEEGSLPPAWAAGGWVTWSW